MKPLRLSANRVYKKSYLSRLMSVTSSAKAKSEPFSCRISVVEHMPNEWTTRLSPTLSYSKDLLHDSLSRQAIGACERYKCRSLIYLNDT